MSRVFFGAASPRWAALTLSLAGLYNILWGAAVIGAPNFFFDFTGLERPNYPEIWQCVGMIVGVYGVGYLLAARNPLRHWPIVAVGLLGKVLGPIGFVKALIDGRFSASFGLILVFNDLLWWVPFAAILAAARRRHEECRRRGSSVSI